MELGTITIIYILSKVGVLVTPNKKNFQKKNAKFIKKYISFHGNFE
jgi:hypothetical protein